MRIRNTVLHNWYINVISALMGCLLHNCYCKFSHWLWCTIVVPMAPIGWRCCIDKTDALIGHPRVSWLLLATHWLCCTIVAFRVRSYSLALSHRGLNGDCYWLPIVCLLHNCYWCSYSLALSQRGLNGDCYWLPIVCLLHSGYKCSYWPALSHRR